MIGDLRSSGRALESRTEAIGKEIRDVLRVLIAILRVDRWIGSERRRARPARVSWGRDGGRILMAKNFTAIPNDGLGS